MECCGFSQRQFEFVVDWSKSSFIVHVMSLAYAKAFGKPPAESQRIEEANAFQQVKSKDPCGLRTLLLTDGAPCYKALAKKCQEVQPAVAPVHPCQRCLRCDPVKKRRKVKVHTDGIDGF